MSRYVELFDVVFLVLLSIWFCISLPNFGYYFSFRIFVGLPLLNCISPCFCFYYLLKDYLCPFDLFSFRSINFITLFLLSWILTNMIEFDRKSLFPFYFERDCLFNLSSTHDVPSFCFGLSLNLRFIYLFLRTSTIDVFIYIH